MIYGLEIMSGHYGVFNHFLDGMQNNSQNPISCGKTRSWNELVGQMDAEKIAAQLYDAGAAYYFITIMQGTKYMLAPNQTFDEIAGTKPGEACATRDFPMDLAKALSKYGIKLYLYYTGDGPWKDEVIGKRFGFTDPREDVSEEFVKKWAAVLEEYAVRYGDLVNGWWIDGCYGPGHTDIKFHYTDELLDYYYSAIKQGNPIAAVAFNNGVFPDVLKYYPHEDFTAGEFNFFDTYPKGKFTDGALSHVLAPLGISVDGTEWGSWGAVGCKHSREHMIEYVRRVTEMGGAVTIDVALFADSSFDPEQLQMLKAMKESLI